METFLSTPSARRATRGEACRPLHGEFLSTPSARRATTERFSAAIPAQISIHALREEGDHLGNVTGMFAAQISIHALREEGDSLLLRSYLAFCLFLSTPSARRATLLSVFQPVAGIISIHALREEGDRKLLQTSSVLHYFYPRPPRGGRPRTVPSLALMILFLSTPSARRATYIKVVNERIQTISIHALREEGDCHPDGYAGQCGNFYPRPPRGGRRRHPACRSAHGDFYPRPPRGGRPLAVRYGFPAVHNFYPRPPRGGRLVRDGPMLFCC